MVFVTSRTYTGDLGGVAGADAKCTQLAEASTLPAVRGRTWKAWLSDNLGNEPALTFNRASEPYRLVDGTQIAADWNALIDAGSALEAPIRLNEHGQVQTARGDSSCANQARVRTQTDARGRLALDGDEVAYAPCNNWRSNARGTNFLLHGRITATSLLWTEGCEADEECDRSAPLYCFAQDCAAIPRTDAGDLLPGAAAGLPLGATVGLAVAGAAAAVVLAVVVVRKRRQAVQQRQDLGALGLPAAPHIGPVGSE